MNIGKAGFAGKQAGKVCSLAKAAIGDGQFTNFCLNQRRRNGTGSTACPNQQNRFIGDIISIANRASDKTGTIKIIAMHCPVIIKPNRINRPGKLSSGAKAVAKIGKRHFMRNRYRKPAKIWHGAKRVDDAFQLFGRRVDWHHDMGQACRRKTRVKHHWRPNMINWMGDHAKDARCPVNPWHLV